MGPYIAAQAKRAIEKDKEIKTGFPVSTSQNIGKAHNPRKPALKRARFRRPRRSESVAKSIIPTLMHTIETMMQYSIVERDSPSCVTPYESENTVMTKKNVNMTLPASEASPTDFG